MLIGQIFRFSITGGTAFLIDYGLLWALTELGEVNYLLSSCISFVISLLYNYCLSTHWVFKTKKNDISAFLIFLFLSIIGAGLNFMIMWTGVELMKMYYLYVKIISTMIVMAYNFISRKILLEDHRNIT